MPHDVSKETLRDLLRQDAAPAKGGHPNQHQTVNPHGGRRHLFEASIDKFESLKETYLDAKGDHLKSLILSNFKTKIDGIQDVEQFKACVEQFKKSDEYKVLETGQGMTTRLLGLQTSSSKTFDKMVDARAKEIESSHPGQSSGR